MQRYQKQFRALGSDALLTVVTGRGRTYAEDMLADLTGQIEVFENRFSRFLPDSELARINNRAGQKTSVSPAFIKLVSEAKKMSGLTEGLYTPFILPALQRAGYTGSWTEQGVEKPVNDYSGRQLTDIERLEIGEDWVKIPAEAALDFGGIGKGYLLDWLHKKLAIENLDGHWLSLGGDIICAGSDLDSQPWSVGIQSAVDPAKTVGRVEQKSGQPLAIATSGVTKRKGINNGRAWHHIIDPRTSQSAKTDILTATVTATSATTADVYAKCLVIAGEHLAKKYRQKNFIDSYVLQLQNKTMQEGMN